MKIPEFPPIVLVFFFRRRFNNKIRRVRRQFGGNPRLKAQDAVFLAAVQIVRNTLLTHDDQRRKPLHIIRLNFRLVFGGYGRKDKRRALRNRVCGNPVSLLIQADSVGIDSDGEILLGDFQKAVAEVFDKRFRTRDAFPVADFGQHLP